MQILSRLLPLGLSLVVSFSALAENSLPVPAYTGLNEGLTKHVTSLREARFDSVIEQKTDYSCGAAALATVLRYAFGRPLGELDVMKGMLVGADPATVQQYGFSMLDMKRFVQSQGLRASGFLADKTRLAQLRIPVITLIDSGGYKHFVVIRRVQNDEVHLADPAMGNRSMPLEDFARQWNGVLLAVAGPGYLRDTPLLQPRRVFSARTSINNSQPVPIAELLEFGFQHSDFF